MKLLHLVTLCRQLLRKRNWSTMHVNVHTQRIPKGFRSRISSFLCICRCYIKGFQKGTMNTKKRYYALIMNAYAFSFSILFFESRAGGHGFWKLVNLVIGPIISWAAKYSFGFDVCTRIFHGSLKRSNGHKLAKFQHAMSRISFWKRILIFIHHARMFDFMT